MHIPVTCQHCFTTFKVAARFAGKKGRCPNADCGKPFVVQQVENDWSDDPPRPTKSKPSKKKKRAVAASPAPVALPPRADGRGRTASNAGTGTNWILPVSLGGGGVLVVLLLIVFFSSGGDHTPAVESVAAADSQPAPQVSDSPSPDDLMLIRAQGLEPIRKLQPVAMQVDNEFPSKIKPFLTANCVDCHSGDDPQAGIDLEKFHNRGEVLGDRKTWEKVLGMVQIGAMPPADMEQPPESEMKAFIAWVDDTLHNIDCNVVDDPGRETIQRLNVAEYNNTIRDLLGVDIKPGKNFPADDVGEGFDNIGDVLSLPSLLMEKYLNAAEDISQAVVVETHIIPVTRKTGNDFKVEGSADARQGGISFPSRGTATAKFEFPKQGEYIVRVRAGATQAGNEPAEMLVQLDGKKVDLQKIREHNQPESFDFKVKVREGKYDVSVSFTNDFYDPKAKRRDRRDRNLMVDWVEVEGPLEGVEIDPPAAHKAFVIATPDDKITVKQAATKIFTEFLPRAFRRPVEAEEVERIATLVELMSQEGESFEESLRIGLQAALVSPSFIFRVEADPRPDDPGFKRKISDYELATRLSYFLWSSMPDDELFSLAEQKKLSDPQVLEQQVHRMLASPKSRALVENFAGQWLNLRNLDEINFDQRTFKTFNDKLRADMIRETYDFTEHIIKEDRSILDFLEGKYTFVNERLAKHYGIDGVQGEQFQKVSLESKPRAGVLTHSSILALTSNPTRTSPVKRGKWIMDNILGTPPPPAPPNVPELEETAKAAPDATLAEQLARHREDPGCASCHKQMDPLGLAFEKFDAIGQFREREGKRPIDDSGELPNGKKIQGAMELVSILKEQQSLFINNLTEKMLTYALGRGLKYYDACATDGIVESLKQHDHKFSALILGVVRSEPFQMRRGDGGKE